MCRTNVQYPCTTFSNALYPPQIGPLHYEIASHSPQSEFSRFVKCVSFFTLYALGNVASLRYHHVGGVRTSQAARERRHYTRGNSKGNSSFFFFSASQNGGYAAPLAAELTHVAAAQSQSDREQLGGKKMLQGSKRGEYETSPESGRHVRTPRLLSVHRSDAYMLFKMNGRPAVLLAGAQLS